MNNKYSVHRVFYVTKQKNAVENFCKDASYYIPDIEKRIKTHVKDDIYSFIYFSCGERGWNAILQDGMLEKFKLGWIYRT